MATARNKTRECSTHTISETVNGVQHDFEVIFEVAEYNDILVKISEDGKRAVVGYLSRDDDAGDPRKEYDNVGTMVCWHGRYNLGDEQRTDDARDFFKELACTADYSVEERIEWWGNQGWERLRKKHHENFNAMNAELDEHIRALVMKVIKKHYVMLPLFLYDHSGITMRTCDFGDRWDSGQVGWIYCSREKAIYEWGGKGKRFTKQVKEKATKYLKGEVETYDQYLTGDVWGVCSQLFVNVAEEGDEPEWEAFEGQGLIGYNSDGSPINGDLGRDECWGHYGDKWAEEELKSRVDSYDDWLATPIPEEEEDPEQLKLFQGGKA